MSQPTTSQHSLCRTHSAAAGSHVCHVTNLGEEKPALETRIVNVPLLKRNGRPLYLDVETDVFDGLGDDSISQSDMDYWFTADAEELATEYLEPAQVVANTQFTVRNYTLGNVRTPLSLPQSHILVCCCTKLLP